MSFEIDALPEFEKELKRLAKKYMSLRADYQSLLESLPEIRSRVRRSGKIFIKSECRLRVKGRERVAARAGRGKGYYVRKDRKRKNLFGRHL